VIEDYNSAKPFASFLPGIAGVDGIPMWVYYVNRGQGIAGFGIESKEKPILDFVPANIAYRRTEKEGFRTFVKVDGKVYEAFVSTSNCDCERKMLIETNKLSFVEINHSIKLKITVSYFNIPHDTFAGFVRKVTFESLTNEKREIEILDGLSTLWPAEVDNYQTKNMANLAVAWFDVINGEKNIPFYKNRATTADTALVDAVEQGHFYLTVNANDEFLPIIYDNDLIFGYNTALALPEKFIDESLEAILKQPQIYANKIPCAYTAITLKEPTLTTYSLVGRMPNLDTLNTLAKKFTFAYFTQKEQEAKELGNLLSSPIATKTGIPIFDEYLKQCFVDNLLRGGYPFVFQGKDDLIIYHVFSRIHGDMEREYNHFIVEPSYYSQGNGNFRDVNQNRRNDVYFVKEAGLYNIKQFMELIQLDGHNPLVIKGSSLSFDLSQIDSILQYVKSHQDKITNILSHKFTPGKLMTYIDLNHIELTISKEAFLEKVLKASIQDIEASYGEGYWVDHWTYNMDLIENYLEVYPDLLEDLMFTENYRYFESHVTVLPRNEKYVLTKDGKVRQVEAVMYDQEKIDRLGLNPHGTNWSRDKLGNIVKTSLFVKLLHLALNKVAGLDQKGMGVMMDAGKPGWNDSMNGLPGIFGSSMCETIEISRITRFLLGVISKFNCEVKIPKEIFDFLKQVSDLINSNLSDEDYFEQVQSVREANRELIRFGLSGELVEVQLSNLKDYVESLDMKVDNAIKKAIAFGKGLIPTYFTYTATDFEVLPTTHPHLNLPNVLVKKWEVRALPYFLEAPARLLKQVDDKYFAHTLYDRIKQSDMYDKALKMYITSESLENETLHIGRARAFTPGWLEREACFMHMEYKYLYGLLKSGLYKEYYEDIRTCLPPFMDASIYGRSTLENSSFIASSKNPNPHNHGRGFVARLTGTTAEMISMWKVMMMGKSLFNFVNNELVLKLEPILHRDFFDENKEISFKLFGTCEVTYHNETLKNTYGDSKANVLNYILYYHDGKVIEVNDKDVRGNLAIDIREGKVKKMTVNLA